MLSDVTALLGASDMHMMGRRVFFYDEMVAWRQDFIQRMQRPGSRLGEELTRQIMRCSQGALQARTDD